MRSTILRPVTNHQVPHPAKFNDAILHVIYELAQQTQHNGTPKILDPFGGTGKLAELKYLGFPGEIYINELEPEWAEQAPSWAHVTIADAEHLPFLNGYFDLICTSCSYGNRLADHHNAKDASKRNSYKFALGHDLTPGNTGVMQWGQAYRDKHRLIWAECKRVLKPGKDFILNISDHVRQKQVIHVTEWHIETLTGLGFELQEHRKVSTPRLRYGANAEARVEYESILRFKLQS